MEIKIKQFTAEWLWVKEKYQEKKERNSVEIKWE